MCIAFSYRAMPVISPHIPTVILTIITIITIICDIFQEYEVVSFHRLNVHSLSNHYVLMLECRYTYNALSKAVFGILLEWPVNYTITLAAVRPLPGSQVTLLGYGAVAWTVQQSSGYVTISLPHLPLDSPLKYGWTLKFSSNNY